MLPPGLPLNKGFWEWVALGGWQSRGRRTSSDGLVWTRPGVRAMAAGPRGPRGASSLCCWGHGLAGPSQHPCWGKAGRRLLALRHVQLCGSHPPCLACFVLVIRWPGAQKAFASLRNVSRVATPSSHPGSCPPPARARHACRDPFGGPLLPLPGTCPSASGWVLPKLGHHAVSPFLDHEFWVPGTSLVWTGGRGSDYGTCVGLGGCTVVGGRELKSHSGQPVRSPQLVSPCECSGKSSWAGELPPWGWQVAGSSHPCEVSDSSHGIFGIQTQVCRPQQSLLGSCELCYKTFPSSGAGPAQDEGAVSVLKSPAVHRGLRAELLSNHLCGRRSWRPD